MKLQILITHRLNFFLFILTLSSLVFALTDLQSGVRTFDQEKMSAYAESSDFSYMDYSVKPPSIWDRISWWFQSLFQEIFLNPNTPWLTEIVYYLVLLLVLGAAIFYIVRLRYGGGLTPDYQVHHRGNTSINLAQSKDFDELMRQATAEQNYKLAIRYVYLKALLSLSQRGKVSLKDWKSPYDYERELKGELGSTYKQLATLFEYIWYGDFEADQEAFEEGHRLSMKIEAGA